MLRKDAARHRQTLKELAVAAQMHTNKIFRDDDDDCDFEEFSSSGASSPLSPSSKSASPASSRRKVVRTNSQGERLPLLQTTTDYETSSGSEPPSPREDDDDSEQHDSSKKAIANADNPILDAPVSDSTYRTIWYRAITIHVVYCMYIHTYIHTYSSCSLLLLTYCAHTKTCCLPIKSLTAFVSFCM